LAGSRLGRRGFPAAAEAGHGLRLCPRPQDAGEIARWPGHARSYPVGNDFTEALAIGHTAAAAATPVT
jgi:hypothetical protein